MIGLLSIFDRGSRDNDVDPFESIHKKFEKVPLEIRHVVKLCFCSLGIIFTEVDLLKCKDLDQPNSGFRGNRGMRENPHNDDEAKDDLFYITIPSIPFGAVRLLWQELLDIHPEERLPNTHKRDKKSYLNTKMTYWSKFMTKEQRQSFIKAAQGHVHTPYKRRFKKSKNEPKQFENFVQNVFQGFQGQDKRKLVIGQSDAEAVINFLRDILESIDLIEVIHVKPQRIPGYVSDIDSSDDEDEDIGEEEIEDWLDQHSVISSASSVSTLSTSFSRSSISTRGENLNNGDNFGWEERKRQKLMRRIMKEKHLDFVKVENNAHRSFGLHLFQLSLSEGGFLFKSDKATNVLLNRVMVSACYRQRQRMNPDGQLNSEGGSVDTAPTVKSLSNRSLSTLHSRGSSASQTPQRLGRNGNRVPRNKPLVNLDDQSLWYSHRQTNRKVLEIMLDDASRYTIRLLPSHLMRAENINDATALLQSPAFIHARLTVLLVRECARRHQHDCEELRFRAYRHTVRDRTFKKIVIQSYLSVKNCLVAEHPILDGGEDVIREQTRGEVGKALHMLAQGFSSRGWTEDAISLYDEALKYKKASYGEYHKSVSNTLFMIGSICINQGQLPKSIAIFNEIYAIEQRNLGVEDVKVAKTCKTIAILYSKTGQYDKSIEAYERALKIELKAKGPACVEVAETYNILGIVYGIMDDNEKSLHCFSKSVDIIHDLPERVDIDLASIHVNIGNLYGRKEDYKMSLQHYREALDHEGNRENSARTYHSMGMANFNMEKYEDALTCLEQSLEIRKALYSINDEDVARTMLIIARILQIRGQYDSSIQTFIEAAELIKKKFGEENSKNADVLHNIGLVYSRKRDYQQALAHYKSALEIRRIALGNEHRDVAESLHIIADILFMLNEQDEAMQFYEEALSTRKLILGDLDVDVAASYNNLGVMYYKKGENDKSLNCFQESLHIRIKTLGDERHEKIGDTLHNMGLVYKNKEQHSEALKHYAEALDIRKEKLGDGHPKTADTLYNLGTLHTNNRDFKNALISYEDAIRSYKKAGFPDKHPSVGNTWSWIKYCKKKNALNKVNLESIREKNMSDVKQRTSESQSAGES